MKKKSVTWAAFPFLKRRLVALHGDERGVVAVIAAIMMVSLVGTLGLVVDLGYGYSQRRLAQNCADSGALSGTKVVAEHIENGATKPQTDFGVYKAIEDIFQNCPGSFGIAQGGSWEAYYVSDTNNDGRPEVTTVPVGSLGPNPPPTQASPNGVSAIGVRVTTRRLNATFFAPVLGASAGSLTAQARATAIVQPVVGHNRLIPYTIWAGELDHYCQAYQNQQLYPGDPPPGKPTLSGNNVTGDSPPTPWDSARGTWEGHPNGRFGCNTMTYQNPDPSVKNPDTNQRLLPGEYIYRSQQWINSNVINARDTAIATWWGGSNDFKGYFHTGNTSAPINFTVGRVENYSVQGGLANGTASEAIQNQLRKCWNLQNAGTPCTVVMPIVNFKAEGTTSTGSDKKIQLRVSGFAEVQLTSNPDGNNSAAGKVVSLSVDYAAIIGPTCPATANCQRAVKLVD